MASRLFFRNILSTHVILWILILCSAPVKAQGTSGNDEAYYSKQYTQLYKQYVKEPENVVHNLELAEFYCDTLNPLRNYATAMKYITFAEKRYIELVEDRDKYREVNKLIKKKITIQLIRQTKQYIIQLGSKELSNDAPMTDGALDNYDAAFKEEPSVMRLVENKRMQMRYLQAKRANTLAAFKELYVNYPSTIESESAEKEMYRIATQEVVQARRESEVDSLLEGFLDVPSVQRAATARKSAIAYARLQESPTPKAYRDFMRKYPGSNEYSLVISKMDDLLVSEFARLSTPRQYADFALDNPDNPLADKCLERIKKMITDEHDIQALKIYMEEFPLDVNYNDIFLQYYKWYNEEGNSAPITQFIKVHPDFPFRTTVEDDLTAAYQRDEININMPFKEEEFNNWKSKIYYLTGKKVSFVALQRTLQQYIAAKSWGKIPERIAFFDLSFEDICQDEIAELKAIVSAPDNKKIALTTMVLPAYDMMHPVLYPDGKHIYYNRMVDGKDIVYIAQLFESKKGNQWRAIGKVRFSNLENKDVRIYSFYDNGQRMLLGQNGNILTGEYHDSVWTVMQLPEPINSPYSDFDAYMLPDNSGILFASDRPEGYNMQPSRSYYHGDTAMASDIYYAPLTEKGWGQPVNLGFHVNSQYMECSPSISHDLKTLYFITDAHGGLGYGDLYYTTRDNTDDWTHWSKPTNYGKETNTGFNEYSAVLDNNEKNLILCSNARGRYGCYQVPAIHNINSEFRKVTVNSQQVGFFFDLYDVNARKKIVDHQQVELNGSWTAAYYSDKQYAFLPHIEGLFMPGILFTPQKLAQLTPHSFTAEQLLEKESSEQPIALPCISFEQNKSTLLPFSVTEVTHLGDFLNRNPQLAIEIIVHVSGDSDAICFELSHARGQEIKKLLTTSGIAPDRIAVSGYGNSLTKKGAASSSVQIHFRGN